MVDTIKDYSVMEQKLEQLCVNAISQNKLTLYDVEYIDHEQTLRLYIEDPTTKTATLDDCRTIDRALTEAIEGASFIGDEFTLEVSSPGVYRHLRTKEHFSSVVGARVIVYFKTKLDIGGSKEKRVIGIIDEVKESMVNLKDLEGLKVNAFEVSLEDIKKANVEPLWKDIKQ